jgi:hypothetical protein
MTARLNGAKGFSVEMVWTSLPGKEIGKGDSESGNGREGSDAKDQGDAEMGV